MEEEFTLTTGEKIRIQTIDISDARVYDVRLSKEPDEETDAFVYNWRCIIGRREKE